MARQLCIPRHLRVSRTVVIALATLSFIGAQRATVRAADLAEQAHSLRKVPADASFYSANLRLKEQWDLFVNSKAYSKLLEIPFFQMAKIQVEFQWAQSEEPTVVKFRDYIQSPPGQDALAVLGEMFSDEAFMYGGADIAEAVKLFMDLNSLRPQMIQAEGTTGEEEHEKDRKKLTVDNFLEVLDKHSDTFKVPTTVIGFRIKDQARAKRELDEVHSLLRNLLDEKVPELAARIQRDQVAGHEFLTLRLDSSMIPWDKFREGAKDLDDAQFEKIKNFISKHKLVIALGVIDEFALLSFGESTEHLEKLGEGATLADSPALKRLQKHSDQRIVSLQYLSKAFAQTFGSASRTLEDIAAAADQGLVQAKVSAEQRKKITDDIRSLNLARYMPAPGDTTAVAFLTPRGYEAYQYSDGQRPMMDSSKPLSILHHVGSNPLLMVASRSKQNIEDYEQSVAWLKKMAGHVEEVAKEKTDSDDWAKYEEIRGRVVELLKRFDEATRENLYPAMADGQGAFVMDIAAKSKQWFNKMPEAEKPLPMFELAFAAVVSDAEKLRQAVKAYIDIGIDAYNLVKEFNPKEEMPELKLPKANVSEVSGGKMHAFPLPKEWGVDPQVAVNAALTDNLIVVSTMPKTTERLLQESTPELDTSLKLDRPAALVVHVEFAKFIDALRPWIDYGVGVGTGKLKLNKDEQPEGEDAARQQQQMMAMGMVVPQVNQVLDFISTMRSATIITYEEDGAWVSHSETHIEDLK
jgi:hypothetical protein